MTFTLLHAVVTHIMHTNSEKAIFSEYALNLFYYECNIPDAGCLPCWMFCHFCMFSYKFGIKCVQELLLILAADLYKCRSQTLFVKFIRNHMQYCTKNKIWFSEYALKIVPTSELWNFRSHVLSLPGAKVP